tara:strand:- start:507 stop:1145 length:639 start_codon:yes stop_codon:yes gene_type:complete
LNEITKRIVTSSILLSIFYATILNKVILTVVLFFCLYQLVYEFLNLVKKIFKQNYKILLLLILILSYLTYVIIKTWLILSGDTNNDKIIFFILISICIASDIGGIIFGKIFKGKKLTKFSPNKTYSGMIGSYLFSFITLLIIFGDLLSYKQIILFSIFISSISQIGDLFISLLKRKAKIKDTDNILPGHGGLLDRFDGLIFVLPIGLMIIEI